MTGWRIGYLCAPELIIEQALKASQYSITNVPQFIQTAAIEALTNREVEAEVVAMNNEYEFRRNLVLEIFKPYSELNLQIDKPAGAFYFFINAEKMKMSSANLAEKILVETGVSVVPGSVYGKGGEGFLRLSLAASREYIKEGTDKLINWTINQT